VIAAGKFLYGTFTYQVGTEWATSVLAGFAWAGRGNDLPINANGAWYAFDRQGRQ